jgi:hypothetical protein
MFCPVCRDEYRPGFTRCAGCDVDLVDSLDEGIEAEAPELVTDRHLDEPFRNFCGFLSLDEARAARDKVRASGIKAEILICEAPGAAPGAPIAEEYWLRVMPSNARTVATLIEYDPGAVPAADEADDDSFKCSACGAVVRANDDKCPGCGLGFEE